MAGREAGELNDAAGSSLAGMLFTETSKRPRSVRPNEAVHMSMFPYDSKGGSSECFTYEGSAAQNSLMF